MNKRAVYARAKVAGLVIFLLFLVSLQLGVDGSFQLAVRQQSDIVPILCNRCLFPPVQLDLADVSPDYLNNLKYCIPNVIFRGFGEDDL